MRHLASLGIRQALLPPHDRPHLETLRRLGFSGRDSEIIKRAHTEAPEVFVGVCSASSMWTANAATVAPSADSANGRVHFTPANLCSKFHRSIEPETTGRILRAIFKDPSRFVHHPHLPGVSFLGDEGAANHTRFCAEYGDPGLQLFVYGRHGFRAGVEPRRFPARQTYEASAAVARMHGLDSDRVVFAQQNPDLIDAGVFHNDVASVGNQGVFLFHEQAFFESDKVFKELTQKYRALTKKDLILVRVRTKDVTPEQAVKSYLFNTQLITLKDRTMALIAPTECQEMPQVKSCLDQIIADDANPIQEIHYLDVRQSMRNGGGPACLRLRVVLTEDELKRCNPRVFWTEKLHETLKDWITRNYREELSIHDLADPKLWEESKKALDELTRILKLGSVYSFQLGSRKTARSKY